MPCSHGRTRTGTAARIVCKYVQLFVAFTNSTSEEAAAAPALASLLPARAQGSGHGLWAGEVFSRACRVQVCSMYMSLRLSHDIPQYIAGVPRSLDLSLSLFFCSCLAVAHARRTPTSRIYNYHTFALRLAHKRGGSRTPPTEEGDTSSKEAAGVIIARPILSFCPQPGRARHGPRR